MKLTATKKMSEVLQGFVELTFKALTGGGASATAKTITATVNKDGSKDVKVEVMLIEKDKTPVGRAASLQQTTRTKLMQHVVRVGDTKLILKRDIPTVQCIMQDAQADLEDIRDEIVADYPAIRAKLLKRLQGKKVNGAVVGDDDDVVLPSATKIASGFRMVQTFRATTTPLNHKVLQGIGDESAAQAVADSELAMEDEMLRGCAALVGPLRTRLIKFADMVRNGERLHASQFDKLADELRRVNDLNALGVQEITDIIQTAALAVKGKACGSDMTSDERNAIGDVADDATSKCDDVLASLGL
jgi:hypothetical protein